LAELGNGWTTMAEIVEILRGHADQIEEFG
jgi:hypothetical protein